MPDQYDSPKYGSYSGPRLQKYARTLSALDRELEELVNLLPDETAVAIHGDHGEHLTGMGTIHHSTLSRIRDMFRYRWQIDLRRVERKVDRLADRLNNDDVADHYIEESHGQTVYDIETNVPFILNIPGEDSGEIQTQCRQIDIYPTLLDICGVSYSDNISADSLLPLSDLNERKAYIRACGPPHKLGDSIMRCVRVNGYKYIEYPERDWQPTLYDLSADPQEFEPVDQPRVEAEIARELPSVELRDTENINVDKLLEDLGYL